MRRNLPGILIALAAFGAAAVVAFSASQPALSVDTAPGQVPIYYVGHPVEVVLHDTRADVEPVYHQCDGHGHRVFASRHPIDFRVVADPTCGPRDQP